MIDHTQEQRQEVGDPEPTAIDPQTLMLAFDDFNPDEAGAFVNESMAVSTTGRADYGISQRPESPERKIASITRMFNTASSIGVGTSVLSRIAREKRSP